jgi:hypothetical protein
LFDNNLNASMLFVVLFLGAVFGLLFLLAWLEQPASERWRPAWWRPGRQRAGMSISVISTRRSGTSLADRTSDSIAIRSKG